MEHRHVSDKKTSIYSDTNLHHQQSSIDQSREQSLSSMDQHQQQTTSRLQHSRPIYQQTTFVQNLYEHHTNYSCSSSAIESTKFPNINVLNPTSTTNTTAKKSNPFEEEEEEEDDELGEFHPNTIIDQIEENQLVTLKFPGYTPDTQIQQDADPGKSRRKQIFKTKELTRKISDAGDIKEHKNRPKQTSGTSFIPITPAVTDAKNALRISSTEEWRRINEWLKVAIDQNDIQKLKKLLDSLMSTDINVELLRETDSVKLIKNLQKFPNKEIANASLKLVEKWRYTIRRDKTKDEMQQRREHKNVGTTVSGKKRNQSAESETGDATSTSSGMTKNTISRSIGSAGLTTATASTMINQDISGMPKEGIKTTVKARTKMSKPRLTGLEGFDVNDGASKSSEKDKRPGSFSLSASKQDGGSFGTNNSSFGKIMEAKIQAQTTQAKRKQVDIMLSDNFMDCLSGPSSDIAPHTKKSKIIRKKLNPAVAEDQNKKNDIFAKSSSIDEETAAAASRKNSTGEVNVRRVHFSDEIGKELVHVQLFEIEEGERINVSKMSKEEIKHFDSLREKIDVQRWRQEFSIKDPKLMPPGYKPQIPPSVSQQRNWMSPTTGQIIKEKKIETSWKLLAVDIGTEAMINIIPGSKSQSKEIELRRQQSVMEAISLPQISLPITEIDEQTLFMQRSEAMERESKIIPLTLIELNNERIAEETDLEISHNKEEETVIKKDDEENGLAFGEEAERMDEDELKSTLEKMDEIELKEEEKEAIETFAIASPEPELKSDNSVESVQAPSIKEIPTEQCVEDIKQTEEEREDLDIRELPANSSAQQAAIAQAENFSLSKMQQIMKKLGEGKGLDPNLLMRISTMVGPNTQHQTSPQKSEGSAGEQTQMPIIPTLIAPTTSISTPNHTQQFFARPPPPFGPHSTSPLRGISYPRLPFQGSGGRIPFPPPNFSTPPPPIPRNFTPNTRINQFDIRPQPFASTDQSTILANDNAATSLLLPPSSEQEKKNEFVLQPGASHGENVSDVHLSSTGDAKHELPNQKSNQTLSLNEANALVSPCTFFLRFGRCDFNEKCKFSHGETLTMGVKMAMRGINVAARGSGYGRGTRGAFVARSGGRAGDNMGQNSTTDSDFGVNRYDSRRRRGGRYAASPVRSGETYRNRRYHSPLRRRRSRSRSSDRYNRRRRTRSRSRSKDRKSSRRTNRHRSSSSSSSSSSSRTYSRSPTPKKEGNGQKSERKYEDRQGRESRSPAPDARSAENKRRTEKSDENAKATDDNNSADECILVE